MIRLHDARHGTATLLTAAGVAPRVVREILGHAQISTTTGVSNDVPLCPRRGAPGRDSPGAPRSSESGLGSAAFDERAGGDHDFFLELLQRSAPIGVPVVQLTGTVDDRLQAIGIAEF